MRSSDNLILASRIMALQGFGAKCKDLTCTGQIFQSTRVTWDMFIFTAITPNCSCAKLSEEKRIQQIKKVEQKCQFQEKYYLDISRGTNFFGIICNTVIMMMISMVMMVNR